MSDRGTCKVFSPNIFNPTKCQNCYKPKEGHPSAPPPTQSGKLQRGASLSVTRERNAAIKTVVKEGSLWFGMMDNDSISVKDWQKRWYVLFSTGELESFPIVEGEVMRSESKGIIVLQDFIRMLDGSAEIGEELSLGLKSLKDGIYLKTANKVDFENWWKELSNFVPSPMKRAYSASAAVRSSKLWLNKANSNPHQSKATSPQQQQQQQSSLQNNADNAQQMAGLNTKIEKLQLETKKIPKLEEEKRKLELEVNYWKEYVTNSSSSKKTGSKIDSEKELSETRSKMINLQDDLNEAEKKLRVASAKAIVQSKEIDELKGSVEEGVNQINMHKATICDLNNEISNLRRTRIDKKDSVDGPKSVPDLKPINIIAEEPISPIISSPSERGETGDIESKFLTLREKMKRIEKELFLKSKELEKANESRSKVAKYTRSLLQELEAKLNDTQRKYLEANEKLNNANIELEIERERRKRIESESNQNLSRSSSVSSTVSGISFQDQNSADVSSETPAFNENEVTNRYVDYYRSRFREAEAALLEKDKKLSSSESQIREMELRYKNVVKQCKSLDDIQVKLSDATHKLSDRQLKIHELTREVEKLRGYERAYDRISKEFQASKETLNSSDEQINELKRKISMQEKEIDMFKIREVVMKERLSAFEEECSDESDDEDDDDDTRLERSIEAQKRVETTIDLEGSLRLVTAENEELKKAIGRLKEESADLTASRKNEQVEDKSSKSRVDETFNEDFIAEKKVLEARIKELEDKIISEEDILFRNMSQLKEKHKVEVEQLKSCNKQELSKFNKLKEEHSQLKEEHLRVRGTLEKIENDQTPKDRENLLLARISEAEKGLSEKSEQIKELHNVIAVKTQRISDLEKSNLELTEELKEKSEDLLKFNDDLEERDSKLILENNKCERLDKLLDEKNNSLKNLQSEISVLRKKITSLEDSLFAVKESTESSTTATTADDVDAASTNDHNKALWEEFKNMREVLTKSQNMVDEMRAELESIGKKYIESEEKVVELAKELDAKLEMENELSQLAANVESKMEAMQSQLADSHNHMQTKIDYLEKERNNVIHLVNVTSAYITELENSLAESRSKVDELQSVIEESRSTNGRRIPPEGSAGKERDDSLSDQSDIDEPIKDNSDEIQAMNLVNQELSAKIQQLELEILDGKASHENEKNALLEVHRLELDAVEKKLQKSLLDGEAERSRGSVSAEEKHADERGVLRKDTEDSKEAEGSPDKETGNLDFLNRIQELEVELEETRQQNIADNKSRAEEHKKEIEDLREDMAKVLQASIASNYKPTDSISDEKVLKLEEKIRELEKERDELAEKYEEELDMEREAHQYEMEETIRDMLTVKEVLMSGKYNENEDSEGANSQKSSRRSSLASTEELEEIRKDYNKKLAQKEKDHEKELEVMKKDMSIVIDAVQQGGAATAILDLTSKNQALRKELDDALASFETEREDSKVKIEKLESGNFFGLRRNEEMGTKIYQMQIELEELERKHKLEREAYKNQEDAGAINELVEINEEFEKKVRKLENELQSFKENSTNEMELLTMKVNEEKRSAVSEMTDTVLSLEAIIDEMKEGHELDIKEIEERSQEEKFEAVYKLKQQVEELEVLLADCKKDCEVRLVNQEEEHRKEMHEIEETLNNKIRQFKTLTEENKTQSIVSDVDQINKQLERRIEELELQLKTTVDEMNRDFAKQTEEKQKDFDNQISDIRLEYEEKLKCCVKENARRQSVSSRKSESQKIKELTTKIEELESSVELEKQKHQNELEDYRRMVNNLQDAMNELQPDRPESTSEHDAKCEGSESTDSSGASQTRVHELEEQIHRYEKRIDYYRQKADQDTASDNERVGELQVQVEGLKNEMKQLTESHQAEHNEPDTPTPDVKPAVVRRRRSEEPSESKSFERDRHKRWSDLHLMDVVFSNDGIEPRRGPRDSRKRWSDLQLRRDEIISKGGELDDKKKLLTQLKRDDSKSGSVARRKKLWENYKGEEPRQRPLSSIRP